MGKLDFYADLSEACNAASKFLREKHIEWNNRKSAKKRVYSGEREFVADVYHLLVKKDRITENTSS